MAAVVPTSGSTLERANDAPSRISPEQGQNDAASPRARSSSLSLSHTGSPTQKVVRRSPLGRTLSMGHVDDFAIDPALLPEEPLAAEAPAVHGNADASAKPTHQEAQAGNTANANINTKPVLPQLSRVSTLASISSGLTSLSSFSSADNTHTPSSDSASGHEVINGQMEGRDDAYLESPLSDSSFVIPPSEATADTADVPAPVKKSHARKQPVGHIKRARNAFILFRKHITDSKLIPASVEVKHQNISVVAAKMWKEAPQEVRAKFQEMARIEKEEHQRLYPGYRYQPVFRRTDIVRRRVRKDPSEDEKVDAVADALMQGKAGGNLEKEIKDQMLPTPDTSSDSGLSSAARSRSRRRRDPGQMSKGAIKAQKAQARQKQMRANLLGHNLLTVSMYNAAQQHAEAQQRAAALAAAEQQYHDPRYGMEAHEYEYPNMLPAEHAYPDMYRLPPMSYDPSSHLHAHTQDPAQAHAHAHAQGSHWQSTGWDQPAPAAYDATMGLAMYANDYTRPQAPVESSSQVPMQEHNQHQHHHQHQQALPPIQASHQVYGWHEDEDMPSRHVGLVDEGLFGGELARHDQGLEDFESSVQQAQSW